MPVPTEETGISPEISPYNPAIVSDGEISSEMPVPIDETGISLEISLLMYSHFTLLGKYHVKCQFLHR